MSRRGEEEGSTRQRPPQTPNCRPPHGEASPHWTHMLGFWF